MLPNLVYCNFLQRIVKGQKIAIQSYSWRSPSEDSNRLGIVLEEGHWEFAVGDVINLEGGCVTVLVEATVPGMEIAIGTSFLACQDTGLSKDILDCPVIQVCFPSRIVPVESIRAIGAYQYELISPYPIYEPDYLYKVILLGGLDPSLEDLPHYIVKQTKTGRRLVFIYTCSEDAVKRLKSDPNYLYCYKLREK